MNALKTVLDTIDAGAAWLEKRSIGEGRRTMQCLVAKQLGCSRIELYMQFDRPLSEDELAPLREALRKRGEGVPLQHLLGEVEFHGRDFRCDARALVPRPETEELAELLLKDHAPPPGTRVLDLGCGSGVLGLTLAAEWPECPVVLADISPDALALAKENAGVLGLENVEFVESDLFSALGEDQFDLIAANLPYVPERERAALSPEVLHDPAVALFGGADGLDVLRRAVPEAAGALAPGGLIALEIGHGQSSEVGALLKSAGFVDVEIRDDLSGVSRFPLARKPKP
jgi:release factor glutamine methyltransferase